VTSTVKQFRDGTDRLVSPEETLERARRFLPLMGITRVANITGLDVVGVPVATACRPNARSVSVSMGKGLTLAAAKASALMESIEAWHAERIPAPLRLATVRELPPDSVVDTRRLPRASQGTVTARTKMLWIEAMDLVGGRPRWMPFDLAHTNFTLPLHTCGAFYMSSNGLASGNHLHEALSHALCEVVERDATTLWQFRGLQAQDATRLDLTTVDDANCREVIDRIGRAGLAVAAWETTSDVGIASFFCEVVDRSPGGLLPIHPSSGMGTHPMRGIALLRALTEAVQTRVMMIAGVRDDKGIETYRRSLDPTLASERLARVNAPGARSFHEAPNHDAGSFEEDVTWEIEQLRKVGIDQILVLDLTRPEVGIPVVRVLVPGLEAPMEGPAYVPGERARRAAQRP
jgi:ribosomal protein S12 methylthiotransferase accessory factor